MKKIFYDYYVLIVFGLFIIFNFILRNLLIGGSLYVILMFLIMASNAFLLIIFRKNVEYKGTGIVIYSVIWLFAKNGLQVGFCFSNIILLCVLGFMESNYIKFIVLLLVILVGRFCFLFIFVLIIVLGYNEDNYIYHDTHYICENNYEAYIYSAGAMDKFHYNIGKRYEFLNINDIIYVIYKETSEKSESEYRKFISNHTCELVGDKNGFK